MRSRLTTRPRDPIVQNMNARRNALTALFDLDGTLIDSIELIWSCYRHTALVHTSRAPGDEFWLAGLGGRSSGSSRSSRTIRPRCSA